MDIVSDRRYANVVEMFENEGGGQKFLRLNAGAAHGVIIGSQFAVFPLDHQDMDADNLLVTVSKLTATTSVALLPHDHKVKVGCRAIEKFHAYNNLSIGVGIEIPAVMTSWMQTQTQEVCQNVNKWIKV